MADARLVVVSNRLPLTIRKTDGEWRGEPSSGGLASAMDPILRRTGGVWIGWSGENAPIDPSERELIMAQPDAGYRFSPVEIDPALASDFYEGYPNQAVWPLFHYFPAQMRFGPELWRTYVQGNQRFCEAVARQYRPGDLIWVHDYHLMLLPGMLRARLPEARIGFFLHIPFPSSEVYAMLPRGDEALRGLLGADLIAFHTHRHLHHFRSSLLRVLGIESGIDSLELPTRSVRLHAMPIGIAPEDLASLAKRDPETAGFYRELEQRYSGQQVIAAVDRMDYTKGIPQRLRAMRRLLESEPRLKGQVTLVQVAVPSRENIESYQDLRSEVNELVGEINGKLGAADWTPVVYINRNISRPELAALYKRADVACVTPLRDGMNLVAKEYCACKPEGDGVLVLSEFAGAAAEMGEALLVNPYDEEFVAETLLRALMLPDEERGDRMRALHARVMRKTVFTWAEDFVSELKNVQQGAGAARPRRARAGAILPAWRAARRRVLLLDYDGTLVPFVRRPEDAAPNAAVLDALTRLCADKANLVTLISGRRAADLDRWFGRIPGLMLAAEHGAKAREPGSARWTTLRDGAASLDWKEKVRPILEHFVDRTPGSFIEEKELSLAWHYRRVEPEFGEWLAGELVSLLEEMLSDSDARPTHGRKVVEVRPGWANKGEFVAWIAARPPEPDFWLAAGDDRTDEDMFARVPEGSWTVHVGSGPTRAAYEAADPGAMVELLLALAAG